MKNGDLSNELSRRLLVNVDTFTITTTHMTRKFKLIPKLSHHINYDKLMLNKLYVFTVNTGVGLEMISYDFSQDDMDIFHAELDRAGTNPFRYSSAHKSARALVSELPYRPEVIGVFDIPARELMYGHWSYNFG
jgi:hypothetical protein